MPADTGAWRIFRDENLLKAAGRVFREGFCARAKPDQKFRHVVRLREAAAIEIVTPAERDRPAFAGEAVKFEFPERKAFRLTQEALLFPGTEEVRLILHAFRKVGFAEEIEGRVTCGHSSFSVRKLLRVCGRPGRLVPPLPWSSPCGGDPEKASGTSVYQLISFPPELIEIFDVFGFCGVYVQSSAQSLWADTDTIGLVVTVVVLVAFFIAAAWSRYTKV